MKSLKEFFQTHDISHKKLIPSKETSKVLVVEDDLIFETIWEHIIHQADPSATMTWATNVTEAKKLLSHAEQDGHPFEMIIADIFLDGSQTGIDLWTDYHQALHEKFILVSGANHMKILKKHFHKESDPVYLQKPLELHEAITTVHEVLHRKH